jgi:hypothetical protein
VATNNLFQNNLYSEFFTTNHHEQSKNVRVQVRVVCGYKEINFKSFLYVIPVANIDHALIESIGTKGSVTLGKKLNFVLFKKGAGCF